MCSAISSLQNDITTTTRQLGSGDQGASASVSGGRATTKESGGTGRSQGKLQGAKPTVRKYSASELAAEVTAFVRAGARHPLAEHIHPMWESLRLQSNPMSYSDSNNLQTLVMSYEREHGVSLSGVIRCAAITRKVPELHSALQNALTENQPIPNLDTLGQQWFAGLVQGNTARSTAAAYEYN